ncbi:MAG: flavin reductase family protein [Bacteroidales bacterium]|nr:flavin reductase family protein [Bacteroidales bacterium]
MEKISFKPGTLIYPLPAVLVTCGEYGIDHNIITIAWTGTVNSKPPRCYISIQPVRHSYDLVRKYGDFVINLTTEKLAKATDWCGVRSGRDYNKFEEMQLTPRPAQEVQAPLIDESPMNIECRVFDIIHLGSHDMFLADVVAVNADKRFYDHQTGKFDLAGANPISYIHGRYFETGQRIGKFGYSVEKKSKSNRKHIKNKR